MFHIRIMQTNVSHAQTSSVCLILITKLSSRQSCNFTEHQHMRSKENPSKQ